MLTELEGEYTTVAEHGPPAMMPVKSGGVGPGPRRPNGDQAGPPPVSSNRPMDDA